MDQVALKIPETTIKCIMETLISTSEKVIVDSLILTDQFVHCPFPLQSDFLVCSCGHWISYKPFSLPTLTPTPSALYRLITGL